MEFRVTRALDVLAGEISLVITVCSIKCMSLCRDTV